MIMCNLSELNSAARETLSTLGLDRPGARLRFLDNRRPGEELLTSFAETLTPLEETGTPVFDEGEVPAAAYLKTPGEFFFEAMAALRTDPASAPLYAGLKTLHLESGATGWLHLLT